MEPSTNSLNIAPIVPVAAYNEPVNNPDAVAAARAKIASLMDVFDAPFADVRPTESPGRSQIADQITPAGAQDPIAATAATRKRLNIWRPVLSGLATFIILLMVFESGAIIPRLQYLFNKPKVVTSQPELLPASAPISQQNVLIIPKISVNAPIIEEPSYVESKIQKALENGVVHYGATPMPGQAGNSVIVGHSANDAWEPGNYKFVFVLLDKLVVGDKFAINYNAKRYVYEVTQVYIVLPSDVSVLAPTPDPTLTIITCTPAGTNLKRLIIKAKQISPAPSTNEPLKTTEKQSVETLPGISSGLTDGLAKFWDNFMHLFNRNRSIEAPSSPDSLPGLK